MNMNEVVASAPESTVNWEDSTLGIVAIVNPTAEKTIKNHEATYRALMRLTEFFFGYPCIIYIAEPQSVAL